MCGVKHIPLTQGLVALVVDDDYEELSRHKWCAHRNGRTTYAKTRVGSKNIKMHRFLFPEWRAIDHRDGDGLNNQRVNLREATPQQNSRNMRKRPGGASQYTGVIWDRQTSKWRARIRNDGKLKHLGSFDNEADAARAYDRAAIERDPEFHRLNLKP